MNKNSLIHNIKDYVKKNGKKKFFPYYTYLLMDRYNECLHTLLLSMFVKHDVLYINTYTEEYGSETDKVSDFHTDLVKEFYSLIKK